MAVRKPNLRLIAGLLAGTALLLGVALLAWRRSAGPDPTVAGAEPRNRIGARADGTIDLLELNRLAWIDVALTARSAFESPRLPQSLVTAAAASTNAPTRYLRGLIQVAQGDVRGAQTTFATIPAGIIPAAHLYAPYRVWGEVRPTEPNPYLPGLLAALEARRLPPLMAARVEAGQGRQREALSSYLSSHPKEWTRHDLELMRGIRLDSGLTQETDSMIRAALRGGKIPTEFRAGFVDALKTRPTPKTLGAMKTELAGYLRQHPEARPAAVAAATHQLELRQSFLRQDYARLLEQHRTTDPMSVADETVLLLTLSAAQQADRPAFDRWSQELRRRHPEPEVNRWLNEIRNDIRSAAR